MNRQSYIKKSEAGVALILAMLVILVLTVLATSIIFVTQSQVWTSFNYRLVTQCRYGAEGGVHQTMNWLQNVYVPPTFVSPATPFPGFDITQDPVKCTAASCAVNGGDVVLAGDNSFNYPDPAGTIKPLYKAALYQKPVDPISNLTYSTTAKLMAMTPLQGAFPGLTTTAIQIWQVTSVGTYTGAVRNAQVQLVVTYQRMLVSATANALYGTSTACPNLTLNGGNSVTDSYNSSVGPFPPVAPNLANSGGNVGSAGGLVLIGGGATVNGNFSYSPTDPCASAPYLGAGLNGSDIALPVQIPYPVPTAPVPLPPNGPIVTINGSCPVAPALVGCTDLGAKHISLAPTNPPTGPLGGPALYGNLSIAGGTTVDVTAPGTYNINSVSMLGGSVFNVVSAASPLPPTGPIVLNMAGQTTTAGANFATPGPPAMVFDLGGGTVANTYPPSDFNVNYGGTYGVNMHGGVSCGAVIYAPAAPVTLVGSSSAFYGSIVGATVTDSNVAINYDRALGSGFYIAGNYVPMGFNWSSF